MTISVMAFRRPLRLRLLNRFVLILISLSVCIYGSNRWSYNSQVSQSITNDNELLPVDIGQSKNSMTVEEIKTILLWNQWSGQPSATGLGPFQENIFDKCPVNKCQLTIDRRQFNQSSAVVFHIWWPGSNRIDLPTTRWPHQRFVMNCFEPPRKLNQTSALYDFPEHFFNWTFTYRRDSDIHANFYGDYYFRKRSLERQVEDTRNSLDEFYDINLTGKKSLVAWLSSECHSAIGREDFVRELQKYVQVDIFGPCGDKKCSSVADGTSRSCDEVLKEDYLFTLVLEDGVCHEYVSDKFFKVLQSNIVPIVFGRARYSRFAPPHSFINTFDFASPAKLAEYLLMLDRNRHLYAHYLEWKHHFVATSNPVDGWCRLCQKLHDPSLPSQSYASIVDWWHSNRSCNHDWKWSLDSHAPGLF